MNTLTVEAVYEDGVLKPAQPLPLKELEKVTITINEALSLAEASYGRVRWTGDPETLRRLALDPEFRVLESP